MVPLEWFPAINAGLNATAAVLLAVGYAAIRRRQISRHRRFMLSALTISALFLVSYLYYHAHAGTTRFAGDGWVRPVYFAILGTHTVLAAVILPLVAVTVSRALRSRFPEHRRIARITLPAWVYVSITGVVVYVMLYHIYPGR
jgi:putative membrane protein